MSRVFIFLLALILGSPAAEAGAGAGEVFKLNRRSVTAPDAMISEIRLGDRETVVQIEYRNSTGSGWVRVFPPGSRDAFFLVDKETSKKYHLIRSRGVPVHPQKATVDRGSRLSLTLWFEAVPFSKFDLMEGDSPLEAATAHDGSRPWHFVDIDLQGDWREIADEGEELKMISNAPGK